MFLLANWKWTLQQQILSWLKKKNAEYYSFLHAARKQICKELSISSEDDGPLALIHPDIGFKLYGVFEHGKEKKNIWSMRALFFKR